MNFNDYQEQAITFDMLGDGTGAQLASDPAYVAKILGLAGEAGEVAEKYKKIIRDKGGTISTEDQKEITKELGDVLWYVAVLATYLDVPFEEVAAANIEKLSSRKARGTQGGKGDNR